MNKLFEKVAERLQEEITELKWVDWEVGQLQAENVTPPFQFPAALVDVNNITWSTTQDGLQEGIATVVVRVVFGIWNDFNGYVPSYSAAAQYLQLINKIQTALQGLNGESFGELNRTQTIVKLREDGHKEATLYYKTTLKDSYGTPNYIPVNVEELLVNADVIK